MSQWTSDDGLIDVTSAFIGFNQPLHELIDDIHRRGWTVSKIHVKDGNYVAEGKNPHGEKLEATGRTDATAAANLLIKVMRREHMRGSSVRAKLGAWDHFPIEQQFNEIAMAYASAPVYEPKAATAWMDLAQDFSRRAQIIRQQIAVEITPEPVPYESADELREDVTKKRHIVITRAYASHPVWSEQQMLDYRLVVDVLGHTVSGGDWGWHGTVMAFAALAPLLTEPTQKALFTELLGQAAFGQFYRQWGPQKIAFLDKEIEKLQKKENGPGHHPVHPSQSIVPTQLPSVFTRVSGQRYFHTTDAELQPGDEIVPAIERGVTDRWPNAAHYDPASVYLWTHASNDARPTEASLASWGAHDYEVIPLGDVAPDPERALNPELAASSWVAPRARVVKRLEDSDWDAMPGRFASASGSRDPNANWESGVNPLPDNAYLWQRDENGLDPLNVHDALDQFHLLEPGISRMHPQMAKQAVINALRSSLLGTRTNPMGHAIHYQDVMNIPADVDDPVAYMDALEGQRERWNQAQGYAPGSHKQFWPQEQQFRQWVKAMNPHLDDGDVARVAKQEMLHMLIEEEERVLAQDQGEQLPAEVIQHEAYEALKRRLKAMTKSTVDQKSDFGEDHLWHEASTGDLVNYHDLPHGLAEDEDLARQLDAMYGENPANYWFRLQQIPMAALDEEPHTLADYARSTGDLDDGPRRVQIIRDEVARLRQGGAPVPFVVDRSTTDPSKYWLRDGYHRAAAARTVGMTEHPAYVLVDPDEVTHTSRTATHHADMYPPYLTSRLRPIAQLSRHADQLADAAREDLLAHKGHGHHFRATALGLGIPGLGPRQVSHAWMHLAPQTSQLAVLEPQLEEVLGHDYLTDMSNRDYFRHERELAAGRDAAGYNHVPLGPFSAALYDLKSHGPGIHPDRTPFKAYGPSPHSMVDWTAQQPTFPDWGDPYWWASTQEARDQAAQDFDRNVAVNFSRDEVPFQKTAMQWNDAGELQPVYDLKPGETPYTTPANPRSPWFTHPTTGERVTGQPGGSIMQHLMTGIGHQDPREVWSSDYEVGKSAGTIAKMGMAERSGNPQLDAAIAEFMLQHHDELGDIQDFRHPVVAWGRCEEVAEECAQFLKAKGFTAYKTDTDPDELGYQGVQRSEDVGAGHFTYPEHSVVTIYNSHGVAWWTIDFTAAQYGFTEFPKVEPGPPGPLIGPQQETSSEDFSLP